MILTGDKIIRMQREGKILIDPFDESRAGANSYDLTLSDQLVCYEYTGGLVKGTGMQTFPVPLDMTEENPTIAFTIPDEGYVLKPGEIYLGCTNERCGSDHFVCNLEGRSSVGRLGIQVHQTAGIGDLGFKERWTLEIAVVRPVRVYPNVRICQAIFYEVSGEIKKLYRGKYRVQEGPVPSQMFKDFQK